MLSDLLYRYRRHRERNMSPDSRLRKQIKKEQDQAKKNEKDYGIMVKKATKKGEQVTKMLCRQTHRTRVDYGFRISILLDEIEEVVVKKKNHHPDHFWIRTTDLTAQLCNIVERLQHYHEILEQCQLSHVAYIRQCYAEYKVKRAAEERGKKRRREEKQRQKEIDARLSSKTKIY